MAKRGNEVGTAYLSIVAETGGMADAIGKALGASERVASKSGGGIGGGILGGVTKAVGGIGGAVLGAVKTVGKVAGGAVALGVGATVGTAMSAGIARSLSLDGARKKLEGLGHGTESVSAIMDSALASVKGTAFGLGDAATTAASAVAAGIKPGEELTKMLTGVANSAAAAGMGMDEMGSIWNKAATANKAQNDVLNQVADRGIPIYAELAKVMGVSAEEVFKLASQGKVDFKTFEKAMISATGNVAAAMGETLPGKLANLRAALGRVGEMFASPMFEALQPVLTSATKVVDAFGKVLGPVAEAMGNKLAPVAEKFAGWLDRVAQSIEKGGLPSLESMTGLLGVLLSLLGGSTEGLTNFGENIASAITGVAGWLGEMIPQITTAIVDLVPKIISALSTGLPQIVNAITGMLGAFLPVLGQLIAGIVTFIAEGLGTMLPVILPALVDGLATIIVALAQAVPVLLPPLLDGIVDALGMIATVLPVIIPPLMQGLTDVIIAVIDAIPAMAPGLLAAAGYLFMSLVDALVQIGPALLDAFWQLSNQIWDAIVNVINGIVNFVLDAWSHLKDAVSKIFSMEGLSFGEKLNFTKDAIAESASVGWNGVKANFGYETEVTTTPAGVPEMSAAERAELVNAMRAGMSDMSVQIDGRQTVGAIVDPMDGALGNRSRQYARGAGVGGVR